MKISLNLKFEKELLKNYKRVIGIDEVGKGCWAGPVVIGAYIYSPEKVFLKGVFDSKKLTPTFRSQISQSIDEKDYNIIFKTPEEIDVNGVHKAVENTIQELVDIYNDGETYFIVDGRFVRNFGKNTIKVIKADSKYYCVALASIIAKVKRDNFMIDIAKNYMNYSFEKHKGYGTRLHREALSKYGVTDLHRKSYKPIIALL